MKTEQVRGMAPMEMFLYWIRERHSVAKKKDAGKPLPWSDDDIFQEWRFTNVRRRDDKTTRWLVDNWYQPNMGNPIQATACVLARQFNLPATLEEMGYPDPWDPDWLVEVAEGRIAKGLKSYSPAYVLTSSYGPRGGDKSKSWHSVWTVADTFYRSNFKPDTDSVEATWKALGRYTGMGDFIAGQVVADIRLAYEGEWKDRFTFAPPGPGSVAGCGRLFNREVGEWKGDVSDYVRKQFSDDLARVIEHCEDRIPSSLQGTLEGMDWQNCLCEFDKYWRIINGRGRAKCLYHGWAPEKRAPVFSGKNKRDPDLCEGKRFTGGNKCLTPLCQYKSGRGHANRGLCPTCLNTANALVEKGSTTWEELEGMGLASPKYESLLERCLAEARKKNQQQE